MWKDTEKAFDKSLWWWYSEEDFSILPTEQRLVNNIFDEVHLKSGLPFNSGHISGTSGNKEEKLATIALVFEMISLHGGPRIIPSVHSVFYLNAEN